MLSVRPLGHTVGAEILGVGISGLDEPAMATIETALTEHSVIVLRNQRAAPGDLLAFARRFGELEINAFDRHALEGHPGILKVSNIKEGGKDIGYADAGSFWHTDMSYTRTPPRLTMLYAIEIPQRDGVTIGDTLFASAVAAYDALSPAMKARIDGLKAIHDFSAKKRGVKVPVKLTPEQVTKNPPVVHPVVRTHPRSGRKAIYVTADECTGIVGWDADEARMLIEELASHVVRPAFQYRHKWHVGDLLIWDNCAVQHVVDRDYEWPRDRRLLYRCTVNGSVPF